MDWVFIERVDARIEGEGDISRGGKLCTLAIRRDHDGDMDMDMDRNKIKNIKQKIKGGCVSDDAGKTIMMDDETGTGRDGGDAVVRGSKFWSRAFTVDGWMDGWMNR